MRKNAHFPLKMIILTMLCLGITLFAEESPDPSFTEATHSYEVTIFKTITLLIGLLVLIFLTIWTLRRLSQGRLGKHNHFKSIKVLEKRPLSPKSMLYLVEVHGKKVLIAESQYKIKKISTIAHPTPKDL